MNDFSFILGIPIHSKECSVGAIKVGVKKTTECGTRNDLCVFCNSQSKFQYYWVIHREKKSFKLPQERPFEFTVRFHVYFT